MRKNFFNRLLLALLLLLLASGCGHKVVVIPSIGPEAPEKRLARMGYSIQVGAFANLENAVSLTRSLERNKINAYYFVHKTGLYKVRFGDFTTKEDARKKAETIRNKGIIDEYYIVSPDDYTVAKERKYGQRYVRNEIVGTAESFIGVPYQWGGTSADDGFDCSGLTMAVYQLNGLNLPRTSKEQFGAGSPVSKTRLKKGDLVFFATSKGKEVSHVGIYTGYDKFIHAPGKGQNIRADSLSSGYFENRYAGARTYLW